MSEQDSPVSRPAFLLDSLIRIPLYIALARLTVLNATEPPILPRVSDAQLRKIVDI
jgi:hypothetical protein